MWREVEVVGVGNVASLCSARAFVWGDVDPHGGGLGAGEPDDSAVEVKIISCTFERNLKKNSGVQSTPSLVESTPVILRITVE